MAFEQILGKIGDKIDETANKINKKVKRTSEELKIKINKSREDVSDEFIKKMNKLGEQISPENKNLTNFERAAANVAIGVAKSLEEGYEKIKQTLFIEEKQRKTKYGLLGGFWSKSHIPKERGYACLGYAKIAEKAIPSQNKLKKEILKDVIESLSSSPTELYGFYVYGHLRGKKQSKDHERKKEMVKKYLMSKRKRNFMRKKMSDDDEMEGWAGQYESYLEELEKKKEEKIQKINLINTIQNQIKQNQEECICNEGIHDGKRIDCGCQKCH